MDFLSYFLLISLILNIFLVCMTIYLFIWRRAISDNQTSIVPSELLSEFNKNQYELSKLSKNLDKSEKRISIFKKENYEVVKELKEYLSLLTKNISKKDEEISRLREGYDIKIFKGFLNRFFRVYRIVEEDLEFYTNEGNQQFVTLLNNLKFVLKEAFLDCGLEEFLPQKGEEYKKAFGISENIVNIETKIESEDMKIAKIKSSGFKIKNNYGNEIVKPAVVAVYKYKKESVTQ